jgi:hypothetical protein
MSVAGGPSFAASSLISEHPQQKIANENAACSKGNGCNGYFLRTASIALAVVLTEELQESVD